MPNKALKPPMVEASGTTGGDVNTTDGSSTKRHHDKVVDKARIAKSRNADSTSRDAARERKNRRQSCYFDRDEMLAAMSPARPMADDRRLAKRRKADSGFHCHDSEKKEHGETENHDLALLHQVASSSQAPPKSAVRRPAESRKTDSDAHDKEKSHDDVRERKKRRQSGDFDRDDTLAVKSLRQTRGQQLLLKRTAMEKTMLKNFAPLRKCDETESKDATKEPPPPRIPFLTPRAPLSYKTIRPLKSAMKSCRSMSKPSRHISINTKSCDIYMPGITTLELAENQYMAMKDAENHSQRLKEWNNKELQPHRERLLDEFSNYHQLDEGLAHKLPTGSIYSMEARYLIEQGLAWNRAKIMIDKVELDLGPFAWDDTLEPFYIMHGTRRYIPFGVPGAQIMYNLVVGLFFQRIDEQGLSSESFSFAVDDPDLRMYLENGIDKAVSTDAKAYVSLLLTSKFFDCIKTMFWSDSSSIRKTTRPETELPTKCDPRVGTVDYTPRHTDKAVIRSYDASKPRAALDAVTTQTPQSKERRMEWISPNRGDASNRSSQLTTTNTTERFRLIAERMAVREAAGKQFCEQHGIDTSFLGEKPEGGSGNLLYTANDMENVVRLLLKVPLPPGKPFSGPTPNIKKFKLTNKGPHEVEYDDRPFLASSYAGLHSFIQE